jgi:general secretion pathway protein L
MTGNLESILKQDIDPGAVLRWWLRELGDLAVEFLPRRWARATLIVEAEEGRWLLARETARGRLPLGNVGEVAARGEAVAVLLPASMVFRKTIRLPEEGARDLGSIVRFEIARHTPLTAERAYFQHRIVGRGPLGIEVELTVVSREPVDALLRTLAAQGLAVESVTLGDAPAGERRRRSLVVARRGAEWRLVDGAVIALSLAAALAAPLVVGYWRLAALDREIIELRPAAEAVLADQQRDGDLAQRLAALAGLRATTPLAVETVAALTKALPDGTWLTALQLAGREVTIEGFSPNAAQLAKPLETGGTFQRVEFRAPIAREPATGAEHFHFGLTLRKSAP